MITEKDTHVKILVNELCVNSLSGYTLQFTCHVNTIGTKSINTLVSDLCVNSHYLTKSVNSILSLGFVNSLADNTG